MAHLFYHEMTEMPLVKSLPDHSSYGSVMTVSLFACLPVSVPITMEASTLLSFPISTSKPPPLPPCLLTRPVNPFLSFKPKLRQYSNSETSYSSLTITAAISRTKKEETLETVKQQLENCYLLAGINYKGFTVKQFQDLRKSLPETTKLIVAKNTLVYKAIEGTEWEALKPCMAGMNAWLFVQTEEIPAALKPYRDFQKERKLDNNDFTGAVFEGKFYAPDSFKALESMPSRAEVYAKLLGSLQSPASGLVKTLQGPARQLVMVLNAYAKKLEEESGGQ